MSNQEKPPEGASDGSLGEKYINGIRRKFIIQLGVIFFHAIIISQSTYYVNGLVVGFTFINQLSQD